MARKRSAERPPFTPAVLRWARDRAGISVEEAAGKLKVPPENLSDWESDGGDLAPTVKQARDLAEFYGRSFLELFLPAPPDLPEPRLIPDFRLYRGADDPSETRELKDIQIWAETQRDNALDLYADLNDEVPSIPEHLFSTIESDAESVARATRESLQFPIEQQTGWPRDQRYKIPSLIRDKIETLGILTLRRSDLKRHQIRGFCIAEYPLPIVIFTNESPNAQAFTLGHEFAHVLLRQSAISGKLTRRGGDAGKRTVEDWCNKFSAAFLMPRDTVLARYPRPAARQDIIEDDVVVALSEYFAVSEEAMLLRLVQLEYVKEEYYWETKKPAFDEIERRYKAYGRGKYYGKRYSNSLGSLYTALVIEAWNSGKITNHNAAEFMGIKSFEHLRDIRDNFGT